MEFETLTNENRVVEELDLINVYAQRWRPNTKLVISVTRRHENNDPLRKAYYAGILKPFGEYLGYDAHERNLLHRQLKILWFNVEPDGNGVHRDVPHVFHSKKSRLSDEGKKNFMDWVVRLAASKGCIIQRRNQNGA